MTNSNADLARRITALRQARAMTLDSLAEASGISRATLSRIERAETSPTAATLGQLAHAFQLPMADLFAAGEATEDAIVRKDAQVTWQDPDSGFLRRSVSPPRAGYRGTVIAGEIPAGRSVTYAMSPVPELEHHLVLQSGVLELTLGGETHVLRPGDCLRFRLSGGNSYRAPGPDPAEYLLCVIAP